MLPPHSISRESFQHDNVNECPLINTLRTASTCCPYTYLKKRIKGDIDSNQHQRHTESDNEKMVQVKALYNGERRRFSVPDAVSFAQLQSQLCSTFTVGGMAIKYRDGENDLITITCDDELREAIVADEILRIELVPDSTSNVPVVNISRAQNEHTTDPMDVLGVVVVGWLILKAIPVWAIVIGGFAAHRHMKRNPLAKQRVMNFLNSRRLGLRY